MTQDIDKNCELCGEAHELECPLAPIDARLRAAAADVQSLDAEGQEMLDRVHERLFPGLRDVAASDETFELDADSQRVPIGMTTAGGLDPASPGLGELACSHARAGCTGCNGASFCVHLWTRCQCGAEERNS